MPSIIDFVINQIKEMNYYDSYYYILVSFLDDKLITD